VIRQGDTVWRVNYSPAAIQAGIEFGGDIRGLQIVDVYEENGLAHGRLVIPLAGWGLTRRPVTLPADAIEKILYT
jgi:hypothetical protein